MITQERALHITPAQLTTTLKMTVAEITGDDVHTTRSFLLRAEDGPHTHELTVPEHKMPLSTDALDQVEVGDEVEVRISYC